MAKKDLIIGGASGYTWDQLKFWVESIKATSFKGDIVLCVSETDNSTIQKLSDSGVIVQVYGDKPLMVAPHVMRFFHIWNYMNNHENDYANVVVTDTRDVIFQYNPMVWLEHNLGWNKGRALVTSCEGLRYKDEPWGNNNLLQALGPFFHNIYKDSLICNVGTIGGHFYEVKDLLLMLFQLCINRPIKICDQAMYNFLINQEPYLSIIRHTDNTDDWAIQLGTTVGAVSAGVGDLGKGNLSVYLDVYEDVQPSFTKGLVLNPQNRPYAIVHQWDRIPHLKAEIEKSFSHV